MSIISSVLSIIKYFSICDTNDQNFVVGPQNHQLRNMTTFYILFRLWGMIYLKQLDLKSLILPDIWINDGQIYRQI